MDELVLWITGGSYVLDAAFVVRFFGLCVALKAIVSICSTLVDGRNWR